MGLATIRWCSVGLAAAGGTLMLLFQLGSWAWSGMNVLTSAYLTVTCAGLVAVICSLRIRDFRPRPLALFVVGGSLALATLSSFLAIYQLSQSTVSDGGALYVAGIPVNLTGIYALTASGCAAAAGFARWSAL